MLGGGGPFPSASVVALTPKSRVWPSEANPPLVFIPTERTGAIFHVFGGGFANFYSHLVSIVFVLYSYDWP